MTAMKKFSAPFALALLIALPFALQLSSVADDAKEHHVRYKLVDLTRLGGPSSFLPNGLDGILNNNGELAGWAETGAPDPYAPDFCVTPNCQTTRSFLWHHGHLKELPLLHDGTSANAVWISGNGIVGGNAQTGKPDPLIASFPTQVRAVLWHHGRITNLGKLKGGHESFIGSVNTRGQAVGLSTNDVVDPFSLFGVGFQIRAFFWQDGHMRDIGTLGGPDANAFFVNERGQVAGVSYLSNEPNANTGIPTVDPFFWWHGKMYDVGSLGGTIGQPNALNNRGQIVGISNLTGDQISHPFLWEKGVITDLGTLGGDSGYTNWINHQGVIAGKADLPGESPQNHNAVIWKHGQIQDLGTLLGDSCANAYFVNSWGQVVGTSESRELCLVPTGEHAFLWEHGGPMVDLNTLIPANSNLALTFAVAINDQGEIAGFGVPPGCAPSDVEACGHAYLLIPCDRDGDGECEDALDNTPSTVEAAKSAVKSSKSKSAHSRLRIHLSGAESARQ